MTVLICIDYHHRKKEEILWSVCSVQLAYILSETRLFRKEKVLICKGNSIWKKGKLALSNGKKAARKNRTAFCLSYFMGCDAIFCLEDPVEITLVIVADLVDDACNRLIGIFQ